MAARKVRQFTEGVDHERFLTDELVQNAVLWMIIVIGEAAFQVSEEKRAELPGIPWRQIVGIRHKLILHDFRIDPERVWDVVENHVPSLIEQPTPVRRLPRRTLPLPSPISCRDSARRKAHRVNRSVSICFHVWSLRRF